jgi:UDP-glucose 4-epimerase
VYSLRGHFKRALVTGGAGFVGSHLVEELLADGLEVVSVDDYSAGKRENLAHLERSRLEEVEVSVTDFATLRPLFEGVDVVFHEACSKMTVCLRDPRRDLEVNAEGTYNVLEAARQAGVKKLVHASTGSVYGEPQYFPSDESHPLNPTSFYGCSKLAGEKYARVFHHLFGLDTALLRYYHVYGPRQDASEVGGVCSIFARQALLDQPITIFGDGTQIRSFTYVKDVVNINKLMALRPETAGQAYNCASGIQVTIRELADAIVQLLGKPDHPIRYADWKLGDIKNFQVDNRKLKALGFEFQTDFRTGLAQTLESVKQYARR